MRFIFLYIWENLRRRRSNYILPFVAFILSGILLCTSVFYLTLSVGEPPEEVPYYPYQKRQSPQDQFHLHMLSLHQHLSLLMPLALQVQSI